MSAGVSDESYILDTRFGERLAGARATVATGTGPESTVERVGTTLEVRLRGLARWSGVGRRRCCGGRGGASFGCG